MTAKKKLKPKLAIVFDSEMNELARFRHLRAALAHTVEYAKPCIVRTPEGKTLFLNQKEGY
jgi:hypothetical protein